jgi:hypothetical protein
MHKESVNIELMDKVLSTEINEGETIKEYLCGLLLTLWAEKEGFSGKRPFGDSGWNWDLIRALALNGLVEATFDEEGYIETMDNIEEAKAEQMITNAIKYVFNSQYNL